MKITFDELRRLQPSDRKWLTELVLPGFRTNEVTDMSRLFWCCRELKELVFDRFDTSAVTNMDHMFDCCNALKKLDLSGFDTAKVTSMAEMFSYCCQLEELNLSSFDTSSVTNMFEMFRSCRNLKRLDLSGFNFAKVVNMADMFAGCENLRELILSDTILRAECTLSVSSLPPGAFIDDHGVPCYYGYGNAGPYSAYEDRIPVPESQLKYRVFSFRKATQAEWREYLGLTNNTKIEIVPHRK